MQITTTYNDSCSTPSSTMTRNINYRDTLFERSNLTPIRGEPTFETLQKFSKRDQGKRQFRLLRSRRRITRPPRPSDHYSTIRANLTHYLRLPESPRSACHHVRHNCPHEFQHVDRTHQESVSITRGDGSGSSSCEEIF